MEDSFKGSIANKYQIILNSTIAKNSTPSVLRSEPNKTKQNLNGL